MTKHGSGGDPPKLPEVKQLKNKHPVVMKSVISDLHSKFAAKPWNDTFQLVRRCMDKSRDDSTPCEPLVRSLERLQQLFNVSSMNAMRSRLDLIAKKQGMGFHFTETTCYLTADLFYLEVVLLPSGGVEEVKLASHGESLISSQSLLQLLRLQKFCEFSTALESLFSQYNIPGDKCLRRDLEQISQMSRSAKSPEAQVDVINNGRVGFLTAGEEDCPLTLKFYTSSADAKKPSNSSTTDVQAGQVIVGLREELHKLQMASVIPQPPQLDPTGCPVLFPADEVPYEMLPACFLLRLQPAIPMTPSFVNKLNRITDVAISEVDLQWAPLTKLLMRSANSHREAFHGQDTLSFVPLPGELLHRYIFPGASWMVHRGSVVDRVFFTHPAHVSAILELLRHQCTINTLLKSCITSHCDSLGSVCDLHFEVLPESDTSFSVTFQRPDTDSLTVLLVDVLDSRRLACSVFGAGMKDTSVGEEICRVLKRSMSIPVTLTALYSRLEGAASDPLCPDRPTTAEDVNDLLTSLSIPVTEPNHAHTSAVTVFGQSGSEPERGFTGSCPGSDAQSELLPDIDTKPPVST